MKRLALLVAAGLLAGCGQSEDEGIAAGGKVIGNTVTVYSVMPDPGGASRDFVDAEKLALSDAGGRSGSYLVNFVSLDLGGSDVAAEAEASRRAINDPAIIAAIVEATKTTVPLFNAAGILQVAPGDTALAHNPNLLPSGRENVVSPAGAVPGDFARRFRSAFGRAPSGGASEGYRAMAATLAAITKAG